MGVQGSLASGLRAAQEQTGPSSGLEFLTMTTEIRMRTLALSLLYSGV